MSVVQILKSQFVTANEPFNVARHEAAIRSNLKGLGYGN